jgi:hypothetical protein
MDPVSRYLAQQTSGVDEALFNRDAGQTAEFTFASSGADDRWLAWLDFDGNEGNEGNDGTHCNVTY